MPAGGGGQNNNMLPVIALFTAVILIPIVFIVGSASFSGNNNGPNPSGAEVTTPINPVDPKTKELIDAFQVLSNPQDVLAHPEKLDPLKTVLKNLVQGLTNKDPLYSKVPTPDNVLIIAQRMLDEIKTVQTFAVSNKAKAKEALTKLQADAAEINKVTPTNNIAAIAPKDGFSLPIQPKDMHGGFNGSPHGTRHHTALLGHWGCKLYDTRACGRGDAADIYAPADKPVFAPFTATVANVSPVHKKPGDSFVGFQVVLISTDANKTYDAAFLHLNKNSSLPRKGSILQVGQLVGTLYALKSGSHLHFELWLNGKVISSDGATGRSIGEKVWNNQKKALGF